MMYHIGSILIGIGLILCFIGAIALLCCKGFYGRLITSSVIDTCGFFTVCLGCALRFGWSVDTLKVLLIVLLAFLINPLTTHKIGRSAYLSGYEEEK